MHQLFGTAICVRVTLLRLSRHDTACGPGHSTGPWLSKACRTPAMALIFKLDMGLTLFAVALLWAGACAPVSRLLAAKTIWLSLYVKLLLNRATELHSRWYGSEACKFCCPTGARPPARQATAEAPQPPRPLPLPSHIYNPYMASLAQAHAAVNGELGSARLLPPGQGRRGCRRQGGRRRVLELRRRRLVCLARVPTQEWCLCFACPA